MSKLKITLTLTADEADLLVKTLCKGADSWYGAGLQIDSKKIAAYVGDRVDAAIFARGSARRRADQIKLLDAESASRTRASVTAEQRASNDQAFSELAQIAANLIQHRIGAGKTTSKN